ncbi:DJ-1/PfpI family protein [Cellulomonas sp. PhB143]|uniref:DJ-1/PfpI family protein n=1 Tax=Cellulomonas sp. PhB143 TaxID=2485186 RepID=UPI000F499247|nr:DJ-1/PfpI family protein [Cellulomonas sp. PhB143]ROS73030.1 DJ-1/PfpI family protein [Cellulomonas sp. PhB143]
MTHRSGGPHIGILVFDGAEELDVVGPFEVLAAWATLSDLSPRVTTFSPDGNGVRLAKGLCLVPDRSAADVGPLHVLVHPGGRGTRALTADPAHLAWLHEVRATTPVVASVCTGALVLAAAGLLAGRPATTHYHHFDELASLDPSVLVDVDARFVDDGDVVTSAGVAAGIAAGIDMALHLVARLENDSAAARVSEAIQYPIPPV